MEKDSDEIEDFQQSRAEGNEFVMKYAGIEIKRFYSLDSQSYRHGELPVKTKELLGLISSLVLRCDDCIKYHLINLHKEGLTDKELVEALNIGIVVGGSITIPHVRRLLKAWDTLREKEGRS